MDLPPLTRAAVFPMAAALILTIARATPAEAQPQAPANWEVFTVRDGLPDDGISEIHIDGETIWVGTDAGLAISARPGWRSWRTFDADPHLGPPAVSRICIDARTHDAWIGTWGWGLYRCSAGRFERFDQLGSGLAGDIVFAVAAGSGRVWVATNGGLSSFEPRSGTWSLCGERGADRPGQVVADLLPVSPDRVQAAIWLEGLAELTEAQADLPGALPIQEPASVTLGAARVGDATWWLVDGALRRRVDGESWTTISLPLASPRAIRTSGDGSVVLLGDNAAGVLHDWSLPTWRVYRCLSRERAVEVTGIRGNQPIDLAQVAVNFPLGPVRCAAAARGEIWLGTSRGLAHGCAEKRHLWKSASAAKVPAAPHHRQNDHQVPRIGVLSPSNPMMLLPGQRGEAPEQVDVAAVQLAIEEANAAGGFRGQERFELVHDVHGYARYGWTLPEDDLATCAFRMPALGVIAWMDSNDRYLAALAQACELPIVNIAQVPLAAAEGEGVWVFTVGSHAATNAFPDHYRARFRREPAAGGERAYQATRMLIAAIEAAGLDRKEIAAHLSAASGQTVRERPPGR